MTTRRDFCKTLAALAASSALGHRRLIAQIVPVYSFTSKKLPSGGALVIGTLNDGGNVLILPSEKGTIVVDAKFAHTALDLRRDIETHINGEPDLLINTHHHTDHSGGNWAFREDAVIVAHSNFNSRLGANLPRYVRQAEEHLQSLKAKDDGDPKIGGAAANLARIKTLKAEDFAATTQIEDELTIDHGGVDILVHHFGDGHTDNDLVVFLPELNILHAGDLLFHNLHPFIDRSAKADTVGWQISLRKTIELCNEETIVIPGHGEVTNKAALQKQVGYFDQMREIVTAAMKEGRSKDTISAMNPEPFKDYGFEQIRPLTLSAMYEEISEGTS
jgi:cyclase